MNPNEPPSKKFKFKPIVYEKEEPEQKPDAFDDDEDSFLISAAENFENMCPPMAASERCVVTSTPKKGYQTSETRSVVFGNSVKGFVRPKRDAHIVDSERPLEPQPHSSKMSSNNLDVAAQTKVSRSLPQAKRWKILRTIENADCGTSTDVLDAIESDDAEEYLIDYQNKINMALAAKKLKKRTTKQE